MDENYIERLRKELKMTSASKIYKHAKKPNKHELTPHPKKYVKHQLELASSSSIQKRQLTPHPKKRNAKQKLVLASSSSVSSLSSNFTCRKSQFDIEPIGKKRKLVKEINFDDLDEDEAENSKHNYSFNDFFKSKSQPLNESLYEAHEGIDHEFSLNSWNHDTSVSIIHSGDSEDSTDEDEQENSMDEDETSLHNSMEITKAPETRNDSTKCYELPDTKLIIICSGNSVHVHGLTKFQVLYGKLEIFGHTIEASPKKFSLFSPRGSALLSLRNSTDFPADDSELLTNLLPQLKKYKHLRNICISENSLVILCEKLHDYKSVFMEKYISQQILPWTKEKARIVVEPKGNWNIVKTTPEWVDILDKVEKSSKVLLTGGKGVGKSTFLRYAINYLLQKFEEIRVIDLDPGQAEFTVAGCISVVTVSEPLFGPNYTHLKTPERSILTNINPVYEPERYLEAVTALSNFCKTLGDMPTLINSMGLTTGLGLNIISATILLCRPTDVVQIQSVNYKKNFQLNLSLDNIQSNCSLFLPSTANDQVYNLHKISSMTDENEGWVLEPRQVREMSILSYLGEMMSESVLSLLHSKLPMYEINLSSIKIQDLTGKDISPAAAIAKLVGLCCWDYNSNVFQCFGRGVVRGIDFDANKLVLITPEIITTLDQVDCIVIDDVNLPPSIYMTVDDVTGEIPYVMEGSLLAFGQFTKRSYIPAKLNRNNGL